MKTPCPPIACHPSRPGHPSEVSMNLVEDSHRHSSHSNQSYTGNIPCILEHHRPKLHRSLPFPSMALTLHPISHNSCRSFVPISDRNAFHYQVKLIRILGLGARRLYSKKSQNSFTLYMHSAQETANKESPTLI